MTAYDIWALYTVWGCWWLAPAAVVLDVLFADPRLPWPHPVCLVGRMLTHFEGPARAVANCFGGGALALRLAGLAALAATMLFTGLVAFFLIGLPYIGPFVALYLAWSGLALGCLVSTGKDVLQRIETSPLPEARAATSWLVSRETVDMDRPLMRKTLADTLSENCTDAFVAPLFWLLLGGPVGLWLYKAVSTADSQWGYLTPRWRYLGWAAARGDDALAFVPARIAVLLLALTDACARLGERACARYFGGFTRPWHGRLPSFGQLAREAGGMPSPNSGWSMAACAWLCGARMAGPSMYFGSLTQKPWLGPPEEVAAPWDAKRLLALCALLRYTGICGGLSLWLVFWAVSL